MSKIHILQLAGFGDTLSAITRLPAVKEKHPDHEIVFWLGGFGKSVEFSKDQLEREGYQANIIKNLTFHNQLPQLREFIQSKVVQPGDIFQDWSFCDEIFNNKDPIFYQYPMQFPYVYKTMLDEYADKRIIAIHCLTKSGNAEGFEHDLNNGRFWRREEWKQLIDLIIANEYFPAFVGYGDEDWGFIEEYGDLVLDARMPVDKTIKFLQNVGGCIACNSWDWEVSARAGIPTFNFYTKNHFFIQNHIPHGPSDFWNTCFVETSNLVSAYDVWTKFEYMLLNKKRPEEKYSVCMITLNDEECVANTLDNVYPYLGENDEFVITDGGSTDKTKQWFQDFQGLHMVKNDDRRKRNFNILDKPWADNFEIQKNHSLENAKNEWRVWIDADETYEHIFWNQLPWYIWDANMKDIDCLKVPRINTLTNLNKEELIQYSKKQGWNLSGFGWINYPDYQQRVFNSKCKFVGRTHETIVGPDLEITLVGVHCLHPKTKQRQDEGIIREDRQYKMEAQKVLNKINDKRPVILIHSNSLGYGGTERYIQLIMKYIRDIGPEYNFVLGYKAQSPRDREPLFREFLGNNMFNYASFPEFIEIARQLRPKILHHIAGGVAEFPMVPAVKQALPYTKFVQTSVFGNQNELIDMDATIYVSKHVQHMAQKAGQPNQFVIRNPVEGPSSTENLREEFGIPEDAFVFGRIGRSDAIIYDSINLEAYSKIQSDNTYFILVAPSDVAMSDVDRWKLRNVIPMGKTTDDTRLSAFYNTIDVLAHSRKDGECCPSNVAEAFAHGKPVISHYGNPFNGHIENIQNAGFVVLSGDVDEYARLMELFVTKQLNYDYISNNAKTRWFEDYEPHQQAKYQLDIYRSVLNG